MALMYTTLAIVERARTQYACLRAYDEPLRRRCRRAVLILHAMEPWLETSQPRRAGTSSFSMTRWRSVPSADPA